MITKFKIYDKGDPQIGDYVLLNLDGFYEISEDYYDKYGEFLRDEDREFLENNIGYIVNIDLNDGFPKHDITFKNLPKELDDYIIWVDREDITYFSKNREDLEIKINSDKYNL